MKKIAVLLLTFVLTLSILSGCGSKFDAGQYVQSVLDLSTKGDTKEYIKITNSSKEEAEQIYQDQLKAELTSLGIEDSTAISEELQTKYEQLVKDLLATAKYEIGEVTEKDGNYTVKLKVTQALITKDINGKFDEQVKKYQDEITKSVSDGGEVPSEDEMTAKVYEILYNLLNENIQKITYGDEQTIEVHVNQKDNVYAIPEEDYDLFETALYSMEELSTTE